MSKQVPKAMEVYEMESFIQGHPTFGAPYSKND